MVVILNVINGKKNEFVTKVAVFLYKNEENCAKICTIGMFIISLPQPLTPIRNTLIGGINQTTD